MELVKSERVHRQVPELNEHEQRTDRAARYRNGRSRLGTHRGRAPPRRFEASTQSSQIESKVASRGVALIDTLAQAFLHDALQLRGSQGIALRNWRHFFLQDVRDRGSG